MTADSMLSKLGQFQSGDKTDGHYNAWAESYEQDLVGNYGYTAHILAADGCARHVTDKEAAIIDIGCGTGLVGVELHRRGFSTIDGLDISTEMLTKASEKQLYRQFVIGDMNQGVAIKDGIYDAAICVGSFAPGHLAPVCLPEIIRLVKPGGGIVIFMNAAPYNADGYEAHIRALEDQGRWTVTGIETLNYMSALDRPGKLIYANRSV